MKGFLHVKCRTATGDTIRLPFRRGERVIFWPTGQEGSADAAYEYGYTVDFPATLKMHLSALERDTVATN